MRIQTKLSLLLLVLSIAIISGLALFSTIALDNYFRSRLTSELTTQLQEAEFVIRGLKGDDSSAYSNLQQYALSASLRLTLIAKGGKVVFESELPKDRLAELENHLQRPEVQDALRDTLGKSTRHSSTINIEMFYLAKRIDKPFWEINIFRDVRFLRVGVPMTQVDAVMNDIRSKIMYASIFVLVIVTGVTFFVSRRLARPVKEMAAIAEEIRAGDLNRRIPMRSADEFGELAESLNGMVDKLNEDITKLKKLERVRSEFLGNVSHELRTPIFAMQGMLETLLHGALDDKEVSRDFVQRVLANTQRLNSLLGDLIEISRIQSGEMKMSFRYFDLQDFLQTTVAELLPTARQKNLALELGAIENELEVFGDKERLKQVMVNLIDNAMKYTPAGGRVEIMCRPKENMVEISVNDSGIGISEEHVSRIFERFYRVDRERSREAGGTGLGLAIVKHIVEAHGSNVELESEPGKGSRFSFLLKT